MASDFFPLRLSPQTRFLRKIMEEHDCEARMRRADAKFTTACLRPDHNFFGGLHTHSNHQYAARGEPRCIGEWICTSGEGYMGG